MPRTTLTIDSLGDLSGGEARAVINAALRAAANDVEDRGEDGKDRRVTIEVTMRKRSDYVELRLDAKYTLPKYRTNTTLAVIAIAGVGKTDLQFQKQSPDNPHQQTLPFDEKEGD